MNRADQPAIIFYDGECGLCHGFVKFVLPRDQRGFFHFSPLSSQVFRNMTSEDRRKKLPDSIVYMNTTGAIFVKSDAVIRILHELGGFWPIVGKILRICPRFLRDTGYDFVASIRKRIFPKPPDVCPIVPAENRSRFLL